MPWINDVVNGVQIVPPWGNNIRDHVVQVFVNKSEMTNQAVPKDGMMAFCVDTRITYISVSGAWWVYNMPWQSYSGQLFYQPVGGGAIVGAGATGQTWWMNSMGNGKAIGSLAGNVPAGGATYYIFVTSPAQVSGASHAGSARTVSSDGIVRGGTAWFYDNGAPSGTSRCIIQNAGGAFSINAPMGTTGTAFSVDLNMNFMCSPTADVAT
jgi:hypothetical protein